MGPHSSKRIGNTSSETGRTFEESRTDIVLSRLRGTEQTQMERILKREIQQEIPFARQPSDRERHRQAGDSPP